MESEETSIMPKIIFVAIFLSVVLLAVTIIITALNQGNVQAGQTLSGTGQETLYNVVNTPQTLVVSNLSNVHCSISQVSVHGYVIPMSNLTINNCQVTYTP